MRDHRRPSVPLHIPRVLGEIAFAFRVNEEKLTQEEHGRLAQEFQDVLNALCQDSTATSTAPHSLGYQLFGYKFISPNLVKIFSTLGKIAEHFPVYRQQLLTLFLEKLETFFFSIISDPLRKSYINEQAISNILVGLARLTYSWKENSEFCQELLQLIEKNKGTFTNQGIASVTWALARLNVKRENLGSLNRLFLDEIARIADLNNRDSFSAQHVSNIVWALAKLGYHWRDLQGCRSLLLDLIKEKENQFTAQETSNVLYGLANLGCEWGKELLNFQSVLHTIVKNNASKFTTLGIANSLWAFARLGCQWSDLRDCRNWFLLAIRRNQNQFREAPRAVNVLWALGTLGCQWGSDLIAADHDALLKLLSNNVNQFDSQAIASTFWAFAKLRCPVEKLQSERANLMEAVKRNINAFTYEQIMKVVFFLGFKLQVTWKELTGMRTDLIKAVARITQFNAEDINDVLGAFKNFGCTWQDLVGCRSVLLEVVFKEYARFDLKKFIFIMDALAGIDCPREKLERTDVSLLTKFLNKLKGAENLSPQLIVGAINIFTDFACSWSELSSIKDLLLETVKSYIVNSQFTREELSYGLRALAMIDFNSGINSSEVSVIEESLRAVLETSPLLDATAFSTVSEREASLWLQAYWWFPFIKSILDDRGVIQHFKIEISHSSTLQQEMESALVSFLKNKHLSYKKEYLFPGMYSPSDLVIFKGNQAIAVIEVDGPAHDRENRQRKDKFKDTIVKKHFNLRTYRINYRDSHDVRFQKATDFIEEVIKSHQQQDEKPCAPSRTASSCLQAVSSVSSNNHTPRLHSNLAGSSSLFQAATSTSSSSSSSAMSRNSVKRKWSDFPERLCDSAESESSLKGPLKHQKRAEDDLRENDKLITPSSH